MNRRVYQSLYYRKDWNRHIGERREFDVPFKRFIFMPVPVMFRRAKEEFVKWYNA